jgi:hypothetical protein
MSARGSWEGWRQKCAKRLIMASYQSSVDFIITFIYHILCLKNFIHIELVV